MKRLPGFFVSLLIVVFCSVALAAPGDVGIVLMHGKWDKPSYHTGTLARQFEDKGYKVAQPDMTWSGRRLYDVDYPTTIKEIDAEVKALREAGAKRILVAGMSFGANGAIAYAAAGYPVDGIIAIAPGHVPDTPGFGKKTRSSFEEARKMIDAGNGDSKGDFFDPNSGDRGRKLSMKASVYASFFDPQGMASMATNAKKITPAVPVFIVAGENDPGTRYVDSMLWPSLSTHEKSRLQKIAAGHVDAIVAGQQAILDWVASLGY